MQPEQAAGFLAGGRRMRPRHFRWKGEAAGGRLRSDGRRRVFRFRRRQGPWKKITATDAVCRQDTI